VSERRVINTSPLIYLSRANLIELLFRDAEQIFVPRSVVDEVEEGPAADPARQTLTKDRRFHAVPDPEPSPTVMAWDLDRGESAVIAYAAANPNTVAIIDDLAGRRCARALGLPLRGTLGLVLRAKRQGEVESARDTLAKLRKAGMFLADGVAEAALHEVGE